jgi:predicted enzyme related to lactoylglutathione lyase
MSRRVSPKETVSNTIEVDNIDIYIRRVEGEGGFIKAPKMVIPGIGYAAFFVDEDGNEFGLLQRDESAKE